MEKKNLKSAGILRGDAIKKSSGITLIALIITIIIMLILAGVSISIVVNGGLFKQASNAVNATQNAAAEEQAEIMKAYIAMWLAANGDGTLDNYVRYVTGNPNADVSGGTDSDGNTWTPSGTDANGNNIYTVTDKHGNKYTVGTNSNGDPTVAAQWGTGGSGGNVDKTPPTGTASYDPDTTTILGVTATITTDKLINTPDGWTKIDDTHYTKVYTANTTETVTITNSAGKAATVDVAVTNIISLPDAPAPGIAATQNSKYTDTSSGNKIAVIPQGFKIIQDASTNNTVSINGGLVIQDSNGNQFVWVPCTINGANGSVKYEKWCTKGTAYNNVGISDNVLPTGISSETSQITEYGGFYIARYEAGLPTTINQTTATDTVRNKSGVPLSKQNAVPWNFIDGNTAKSNAESLYTSSNTYVQSGLVTGTQWDTVMKWLQNAGYNVDTNSGAWGNFSDVAITGITSYSKDYNYGATWTSATTKPAGTIGLLKTGNSSFTKANNIYDLAGNIGEFTNELCYGAPVYRPGPWYMDAQYYPPAYRSYVISTATNPEVGFRLALYVK